MLQLIYFCLPRLRTVASVVSPQLPKTILGHWPQKLNVKACVTSHSHLKYKHIHTGWGKEGGRVGGGGRVGNKVIKTSGMHSLIS